MVSKFLRAGELIRAGDRLVSKIILSKAALTSCSMLIFFISSSIGEDCFLLERMHG